MIKVEDVPIIEEGTLIKCIRGKECFLFQYKERDFETYTCTAIEGSVIRIAEGKGVGVKFGKYFPMGRCSVIDEYVGEDSDYAVIYASSKTV